jgi:hypothetical protein
VQSGLWHQINPMLGRGESVIRAAQRLLGTWWSRAAPVRAVLAAGGSTVVLTCESLATYIGGFVTSSSPRKKILTFVTVAIVGLAVIILLLELSLRKELAKEVSATPSTALADLPVPGPSAVESTAPTANPSEREPLVQGALESAPSNDFQPLAPPWAESVPLPRPRRKTP